MNHDWLLKFIGHRVTDPRISRLLARLLRSGILEDGLVSPNEEGAPQGSILSPLLSNIYLHYVLDLWFEKAVNARRDKRKPGSFEFLGFRFECGRTRNGHFKVKRRTSGKRLGKSLDELKHWLNKHKATKRKGELIRAVVRKARGHLAHFAITDYLRQCSTYLFRAAKLLFMALSSKSQRRPYTWKGFEDALRHNQWPKAKLVYRIDPLRKMWRQMPLKGGV